MWKAYLWSRVGVRRGVGAEAEADASTISHLFLNEEMLIFSDCFDDDWLGTLGQNEF